MCHKKKASSKKNIQNICRSFTFYNKYYLETAEIDIGDISYTTLGFFDAFGTSVVLQSQDTAPKQYENIFSPLWDKTKKLAYEHLYDSSYKDHDPIECSYQNIFGFIRKKDEPEGFWESKTDMEFPITFIILFQYLDSPRYDLLKNSISNITQILSREINKAIKDEYDISVNPQKTKKGDIPSAQNIPFEWTEKQPFIICGYSTLDKFDAIVCVKSKTYNHVIRALSEMSRNYYDEIDFDYRTYTIVGFNNNVLKVEKDSDIDEVICRLNSTVAAQSLNSICIKGVFNPFYHKNKVNEKNGIVTIVETLKLNLVKQLYNLPEVGEECNLDYRCYMIIGDEDVRFIARDVPLANFMMLFSPYTNSESFSVFQKDHIFCRFASDINVLLLSPDPVKPHIFDSDETKKHEYCDELDNLVKVVTSKISEDSGLLLKSIYQLANAFHAMERSPKRNYEYLSLYFTFYALLTHIYNLIEEGIILNTNDDLYEEILSLLHHISSTHLVALRSDIRNFQISNFHVNLFYVPSKLRAFYSVFTYKLVEYFHIFYNYPKITPWYRDYQSKKKLNEFFGDSYYFIISPGVYSRITVEEVLGKSTNNRIMVCRMSERSQYNLKSTIVQLSHEIAHHGLANIRSRDNRFLHFFNGYCYAILCYYKLRLTYMFTAKRDEYAVQEGIKDMWCEITSRIIYVLSDPCVDDKLYAILRDMFFTSYNLSCAIDSDGCNKFSPSYSINNDDRFYFLNISNDITDIVRLMTSTTEKRSMYDVLTNYISYFITKEIERDNSLYKNKLTKQMNILQVEIEINKLVCRFVQEITIKDIPEFMVPSTEISPQVFYNNYMHLYRECFADLVSILTLRLSFEDYIGTFIAGTPIDDNYEKYFSNHFLKCRVLAIVFTVLKIVEYIDSNYIDSKPDNIKDIESTLKGWPQKDVNKTYFSSMTVDVASGIFEDIRSALSNRNTKNCSIFSVSQKSKYSGIIREDLNTLIDQYIRNAKERIHINYSNIDINAAYVISQMLALDERVLNELVEYLLHCGKAYLKIIYEKDPKEGDKWIKDIKDQICNSNNICSIVESIDKILCDFEKERSILLDS